MARQKTEAERVADKLVRRSKSMLLKEKDEGIEDARQTIVNQEAEIQKLHALVRHQRKKNSAAGQLILQAAVDKHQLEPVDELLRMVAEGEVTKSEKIKILLDLASYRVPKVKQQEMRHEHDHNFNVTIRNFGETLGEAVDVTPRLS